MVLKMLGVLQLHSEEHSMAFVFCFFFNKILLFLGFFFLLSKACTLKHSNSNIK